MSDDQEQQVLVDPIPPNGAQCNEEALNTKISSLQSLTDSLGVENQQLVQDKSELSNQISSLKAKFQQ